MGELEEGSFKIEVGRLMDNDGDGEGALRG